jgi:RHS repeat-associated protein
MRGTTSGYDASGRLRSTTNAAGEKTVFNYDVLGRLTSTLRRAPGSDRGDIVETIVPDMMGRTVTLTHPNLGTRTLQYDARYPGRLAKVVLPGGSYIAYGYDKGRISAVQRCADSTGQNCSTDTMTYDISVDATKYPNTAGRVARVSNANTTIALGYDTNGVPQRRDQWLVGMPGGISTRGAFRADGLTLQTDVYHLDSSPTGETLLHSQEYWYDSFGRTVKLNRTGRTYWAATGVIATGSHDAWGGLASVALDADSVVPSGRVDERWAAKPYSGLFHSHTARSFGASSPTPDIYDVQATSYRGLKLAGLTDSISGTSFAYWYSDVGRLIAARATPSTSSPLSQNSLVCVGYGAQPLSTKSFGPAPGFGNIEIVREQSLTTKYHYPGSDIAGTPPPGFLTASGPDAAASLGSTFLGYDAFGHVSTVNDAQQFGYDLDGRLTTVTRTAGESETLSYDPLGELARRTVGSTVIFYAGMGATITGTLPQGCSAPSQNCQIGSMQIDVHVNLGGTRIASIAVSTSGVGRTLYLHRDRLGSIVATTLGGGTAGARYRYSAHGAIDVALNDFGDAASELGYAGALRLTGGLLALGVRVYSPVLRTWMQPDPLQPFKYDYADGDPVNKVDPTGMRTSPEIPWIIIIPRGGGRVIIWSAGAAIAFAGGWTFGTWINSYAEPYIQRGLDAVFGPPGMPPNVLAGGRDIQMVNQLVRAMGGTDEDRVGFGEYIHELKDSGDFGSGENGDFTWEELEERYKEWQESIAPPPPPDENQPK